METTNQKVEHSYSKKLRLFSLLLLAIGSITGEGIYVLISSVARIAGAASLISFAIVIIVAIFIGFIYAECSSLLPENGGGFIYVREAFGKSALYIGWMMWLSNMAYAAILALTVGHFINIYFNIQSETLPIIIGSLCIVLFAIFNIKGSNFLSKIQDPLVILLIVTYIIGVIYLLMNPTGSAMNSFFESDGRSIFIASALLIDLFIGFEDIASISEEVQNPRRNIPLALILSIIISGLIYFLIMLSVFLSTSLDEINQKELVLLELMKSNPTMYFLIFIGAIFALFSSIAVAIMASSRNLYALAKYDFIDRKWAEIDERHESPKNAIILSSILCIIMILSGQTEFIISISNISYLITVIFIALSVFKFRKTKSYDKNTFKIPGHPYITIITIILCISLLLFVQINSILINSVWFLIGLIVYLFFSSKKHLYGPVFVIILFFISVTSIELGIFLSIAGILIYFFSIANESSRLLIISGLKFSISVLFMFGLSTVKFLAKNQGVQIDTFLIIGWIDSILLLLTSLMSLKRNDQNKTKNRRVIQYFTASSHYLTLLLTLILNFYIFLRYLIVEDIIFQFVLPILLVECMVVILLEIFFKRGSIRVKI